MKKLRIILTGANGQLGRSLQRVASERFPEVELLATDYQELDVTQQGALEDYLADKHSFLPSILINCAAYTAVDKAESEDEAAYQLNSFAPAYLAMSCGMLDMMMIHISTDYVFDGNKAEPYLEDEPHQPLSVYGETKSVGEENVQRMLGLRALIVRTSWLYSAYGHNFVDTMIRLSRERDELRVVDDQFGSPTYAGHLAEALLRIALSAQEQGYFTTPVVHYTNSGSCSWYQLASAAVELLGNPECRILPVSTEEYGQSIARRPKNSVLSHRRLTEVYGITPPSWQDGLLELKANITK